MIKNLSVNSASLKINKTQVHSLVSRLKKELNIELTELQINVVDSEQIKEINKNYLGHNFSTDIITFNYTGDNSVIDGEVYISYQDAEINAKKYNVSLNEELKRLVIHGILHLAGYNDETKPEKKIMKYHENRLTYKNNFTLL